MAAACRDYLIFSRSGAVNNYHDHYTSSPYDKAHLTLTKLMQPSVQQYTRVPALPRECMDSPPPFRSC